MAVVTPTAKAQFIDAAGVPLAGGFLYTYTAGTTTPQATYTDSTSATANSNPIVLDSRGEANIWLTGTSYKFKLCDADNNEIWTVDNIAPPSTALSPVFTSNVTISDNSSGPALLVTQIGAGAAIRVQDSADPDASPFVVDNAGNVGIGTAAPANALDLAGGAIQISTSGGTARTIISADSTDSIFSVSDDRNFTVKTNSATRLTVNSSGITASVPTSVTGTISATGNITSSAGNISSTAGSISAGTTITAATGITSTTGNIAATAGSVTAGTSISSGTTITAGSTVTATTGVLSNTVDERTSGSGVTVDGVLIKDSAIAGDYLRIASKTTQAASGATVSFSGIPTWARRITVMFSDVSLTASDNILVQIGPSGGLATSGYASNSGRLNDSSTQTTASTSSFLIYREASGDSYNGIMTICLLDPATFIYVQSHSGRQTVDDVVVGGGSVTLTGLATQLAVKVGASATFDSGNINILYE